MTSNVIQHLLDSVMRAWGFESPPDDRSRDAVGMRLCCMVKLRSLGFSLHSIARHLNSDHTTVLYWINKIPDDLAKRIIDWDPSSVEESISVISQVNSFLAGHGGEQ